MEKLIQFIKDNYKNFSVEIEQSDSEDIKITMKKIDTEEINKAIQDFEAFVKNIDDDFFNDICDMFNGMSGINVNKLSSILKDAKDLKAITQYTDIFKYITKQYVREHIDKLIDKYQINK